MPSDGITDKLLQMRISEFNGTLRRVMGLQYLRPEDFLPDVPAEAAARMAHLSRKVRGNAPSPILVLGVMPRSGTNFVRDLLAMHPGVHADPEQVYEFPLLHAGRGARAFMKEFFAYFPRNRDVLTEWDALALLAGAWLRHWQDEAGERRILLKCPHVQNLGLAPHVFPDARIVLCMRDGRDVIDSTMRTFARRSPTRKTFSQLAAEWRLGTDAICTFGEGGRNACENVLPIRYEDVYADPVSAMTSLLAHTGLDPDAYPMEKVENLPVRGSSRSRAADEERWQPEARTQDFNPVRRWADWPEAKKNRFDRLAGPTLRAAGYDT